MSYLLTFIAVVALMLTAVAGWVNNVFWTFQQDSFVDLALGIVGIFVPFIGAVHGIWLWF